MMLEGADQLKSHTTLGPVDCISNFTCHINEGAISRCKHCSTLSFPKEIIKAYTTLHGVKINRDMHICFTFILIYLYLHTIHILTQFYLTLIYIICMPVFLHIQSTIGFCAGPLFPLTRSWTTLSLIPVPFSVGS